MGSGASVEKDITIIEVNTNKVITKIRSVNLNKITIADCRIKLLKKVNSFNFIDETGIEVLEDDELLLATKIMKANTTDLYIKLENKPIDVNTTSNSVSKYVNESVDDTNDEEVHNIQNNKNIQDVSDEIEKIDNFQEEIDNRKEQAEILLGASNVDNAVNLLWGTINDTTTALPSKEIQHLLSIAMVGIEFTSEIVPGARTFIKICADVYSTFQACDEVNDEVKDAKGFVIDITKVIIRVNDAKTFKKYLMKWKK